MSLPINLPKRFPKGSRTPLDADWANSIREAIARLIQRRPTVISGGGGGGDRNPFSKRSLKLDPETSETAAIVTLWPGYVKDILTSGAATDAVVLHMPTVDDVALNATPPPEISLTIGDSVYITYATDKSGTISGDPAPSVIVSTTALESVHYQPPDAAGSGGADGLYYVKIGKLTGTSLEDAEWEPYQNSDIEHYQELPQLKNIGDGAGVCKGRKANSNDYEFRRVRGNFGIAETEEADSVAIDFLGENVGGASAVFIPAPDPEALPDQAVQFRTLRGLGYEAEGEGISEQIQVAVVDAEGADPGTGGNIRIRGNTKVGSLTFLDCDGAPLMVLNWQDGLITTSGDSSVTLGDCTGSGSYGGGGM
jgi:hypothetical protein